MTCNTNKATRSETKKLAFSLVAMKFCNSILRATQAVPTQTFFRLRINAFLVGKILCFSNKRLRFVACWFSFTLRWNNRVKIKLRSDAFMKFLFKIRLKRETNLMQACSTNQHQVIMPSWLPKVPSWLRKNALCLSQSAFSNFAPHVIKSLAIYPLLVEPEAFWLAMVFWLVISWKLFSSRIFLSLLYL